MTAIERDGQLDEATLVSLIQRAQRGGDNEAFDGLYLLYADRIFRSLLGQTGDAMKAEELTSQLFLRLIERIGQYRLAAEDNVAIFSAWLYRIAHNLKIDLFRAEQHTVIVPIEQMEGGAASHRPTLEVEDSVDHHQLLQRLATLREPQRQVLILRFLEGLSLMETAQVMQKTEGAVKALQHRALATLRLILKREGFVP